MATSAAILSLGRAMAPAEPDTPLQRLSDEERAALISAAMAHGIELLQVAERLNAVGDFAKADAMKASALALVRAELKLRRTASA